MAKSKQNVIENAQEVIERFGGIRPMATKLNIPVTTVQGWKKRNVIPGNRRHELLEAAQAPDVQIQDVLSASSSPANENVTASVPSSPVQTSHGEENVHFARDDAHENARRGHEPADPRVLERASGENFDDIVKQIAKAERKAVGKSVAVSMFFVLLAFVAGIVLFRSQPVPRDEIVDMKLDLRKVQSEMDNVRREQSSLLSIPKNLQDQISGLQDQAKQVQSSVSQAMATAKGLSDGALQSGLEDRLGQLEEQVKSQELSPAISDMFARMQALQKSVAGQEQLGRSVSELTAIVQSMQEQDGGVNNVLEQAREQSTSLSQTFEGVPTQDLKAAAMLLGFSQLRSTLRRDNQPFENDLQLLMNLVVYLMLYP